MRSEATMSAPPSAAFSPSRRQVALWVIYGVIGVHVVAMVAKIDEWPLTYYGMYSRVQPGEVEWQVVYGVTGDGREVRLQEDDYWTPLGAARLSTVLRRLRKGADPNAAVGTGDGQAVDRTVAGLMKIYETHRRLGRHHGPPLARLRLYSVTWRLDPQLANLDTPERLELVSEYVAQR